MKNTVNIYQINDLISFSTELAQRYKENKNIEFDIVLSNGIPPKFAGDETIIKQIINTLLSIAYKLTNKGKITLTFDYKNDYNSGTLVISIRDTGIGMSEDELTAFKNGSISDLIKRLNGDIFAHSEFKTGSIYITYIPQSTYADFYHKLLAGKHIDGMDIQKSLERFKTDPASLLEILKSYTANMKLLLDKINNFTPEKLRDYCITVHSIKGASYDIFAFEIGEAAKKLENAAKTNDVIYIEGNNQALIKTVQELVNNIEAALPELDLPDASTDNENIKDFPGMEMLKKPKILAVDDAPSILTAINAMLKNSYEVLTLTKPEKVETLLQRMTPDLFILDCMMPVISGLDLIPVIRSFKEHAETPIIFLSSSAITDDNNIIKNAGIVDFLSKPVDEQLLKEKVRKLLRKNN